MKLLESFAKAFERIGLFFQRTWSILVAIGIGYLAWIARHRGRRIEDLERDMRKGELNEATKKLEGNINEIKEEKKKLDEDLGAKIIDFNASKRRFLRIRSDLLRGPEGGGGDDK